MKMTELDRVEAIDFFQQARSNGAAKNIKGMRRKHKDRVPASRSQPSQIVEILQPRDFFASHIQNNDIRAAYAHFSRRDKQNAHCCCFSEHFLSIEDGVM